jgi:hypothetical protein
MFQVRRAVELRAMETIIAAVKELRLSRPGRP